RGVHARARPGRGPQGAVRLGPESDFENRGRIESRPRCGGRAGSRRGRHDASRAAVVPFGRARRPLAGERRSPPPPDSGSVAAIVVEGVSKHWTTAEGRVHAVDRISFSLDEGTLNVLLGPSGCGKSTTLRLIAGLEVADGGTIRIGGRDVTKLPPSQRNI